MRSVPAIVALLVATSAFGQDVGPDPAAQPTLPIPYTSVEGWEIMIDMDMQHSCFVMGTFDSGTTIRLGVDRAGAGAFGYLAIANPAWKGFKDGASYPISIRFDQAKPWTMPAKASVALGMPAVVTRFDSADFAKQFAVSSVMLVTRDKDELAKIDLTASQKAMRSMLSCQSDVDRLVRKIEEEDEESSSATTA